MKTAIPSWRDHLIPVALLCALTVGCFTPRFFGYTYSTVQQYMNLAYPWKGHAPPPVPRHWLVQVDHAETFYPLSVFGRQAWRQGELPLWFPYSFGGFPMLELGMTGLLYPPRIGLSLVCDPLRLQDVMLLLHLLAAGLGMYALLRVWGANAAGAVAAGVLWELSGCNTLSLLWGHVAIAAAWCPWMLWAAALAVRRRSLGWAVAAGAATGLALYGGSTLAVIQSGLLLAVWYGTESGLAARVEWRAQRRGAALLHLALPLVSLLIALVVGLAYWLPLLAVLPETSRQPIPFRELASGWIAWPQIIGALGSVTYAFSSVLGLVLAVCGLWFNRTRHARLAAGVLLLTALTLSGPEWWLRLVYQLPFIGGFSLIYLFYLLAFPVAVLAGFGLSELVRRGPQWRRPGLVFTALGGAALLEIVYALWHLPPEARLNVPWLLAQLTAKGHLRWLLALALGGGVLLALYRLRGWCGVPRVPAFGLALALPLGFALILHGWLVNPFSPAYPGYFYPTTPLLTELQARQGARRMLPLYQFAGDEGEYVFIGKTPPMLPGKTPGLFGLRSGGGYESLLPARTAMLWRAVQLRGRMDAPENLPRVTKPIFYHDRVPSHLLEQLSVGLLAAPPGVEPLDANTGQTLTASGTWQLVYQGPDGWLYENPRALPRAFLVPAVKQVASPAEALQALLSPTFEARQTALLETPLPAAEAALLSASKATPDDATATARLVRESLNEVEIETASTQARMLVFNDAWAQGWRATVDGAAQAVHRVNYNARGVTVPAGTHRIVFRYRPPLMLASLWVSATAVALLGAWWLLALARRAMDKRAAAVDNAAILESI